ncbi:hypothetical protein BO221_16485 [Archangium sp. Cb G35]|uniref:hypothetical protein n=1 Tax=Archangium sp. Cb G35 TaxID=1920190 RepID=UPI000935A203|nr:hypothetical protein [Archangium sp. Cb G35]OJT23598.1 hypothetical protein BO221_16485 [Archangium sp. Cb G35]
MHLHLLLSRADDHRPALPDGLELASVLREPQPQPLVKPQHLYDLHGDWNDLREQGWAVVAPEGPRGEELLKHAAPLIQWRAEQQHLKPDEVQVFRIAPGMTAGDAEDFRGKLLKIPHEEQPHYLLLLGDADEVSFELQQHLAVDRFVGRLGFARDADLDAYVDKVLRFEREPPRAELARAIFFTVHDRTPATDMGYELLMCPSLQTCHRSHQRGSLPAGEVLELGTSEDWTAQQFFAHAAKRTPGALLTLSHGLGAPHGGWRSSTEQRQVQGAMDLGNGGSLTLDDVTQRSFMPGGLWFSFACFSAGTPARSMYAPWLERLGGMGAERELESIRASAPVDGRPFVAALPQAALANPEGPLAVIGHVDLAWTYSFHEPTGQNHAARFANVMGDMVRHRRAGVALHVLSSATTTVDARLALLYHQDEAVRFEGTQPPPEAMHRALLWMARHDLSGFVLLGDPAVRLPISNRARR